MLVAKSNPNEVYAELERVHGKSLYYNRLYPLEVSLGGSTKIDVMVSLKRGGGRSAGTKVILYLPFFTKIVDENGRVDEVIPAWKTKIGAVFANAVSEWKKGDAIPVQDKEKGKLIFKNLKKMGVKIPETN